jgi:uncharacterized protein YcbK (DUF882 family)
MGTASKYFDWEELLPPNFEDTSVIDPNLLILIDQVRELLDVPCTINANGRTLCGYRPKDCKIGAPKSMHKLGKAADLHPIGMSAEDARVLIRKAVSAGMLPLLGAVEESVSWLHVDCRARINNNVLWFNPKITKKK